MDTFTLVDKKRDAAAIAQFKAGVPTDGPRRLGPPGQASLYFNAPFGNHLELTTMGFFEPIPVGAPDLSRLEYEWRG